jgi:lipopolysaccharide transport protein LptA
MNRFLASALLALVAVARLPAQTFARAAEATPATNAAHPPPPAALENTGPITTQIYSDEASFDTEKRVGVFTGHVRVFDPRFNLQSDKLTVFIHKEESEGLERAIAEGNVGVVRDKVDPKGGPPSKAVGLSEKAVYTSSDGNVELTGSPRVQQGLDTHIATNPKTVMVLNQEGHLTTHGPSRTEIRQEAKDEKKDEKPAAKKDEKPAPKKDAKPADKKDVKTKS